MKKLIVLLFMILPLGAFAQEVKIAFVNTNEIFTAMPEVATMQKEMAGLEEQYKREMTQMEDEYKKKYAAYIAQQDSLTENIKMRRAQEVNDLQQRIDNFVPVAQQAMQKKSEELTVPIRQKIQDAIKAVGEEKGYTYIIDPQVLLFMGTSAVDATPFVKTKLGLK